jgi:hypothetical protein
MAMKVVTASKEINGVAKSASVNYDFGDNSADAIKKHSEDVVMSNYKAAGTVTVQGVIRRWVEKGLSQAEITTKFVGYKLGVAAERTAADPATALLAQFDSKSQAEQDEIIEALKKKAAAAKKAKGGA